MALRLVIVGMAGVGTGTVIASTLRLVAHDAARASAWGVALAGVSLVVLVVLARVKHAVARRVHSGALHADGWLSAVGAVLAGVTLLGTALTAAVGWWWLDPAAAMAVAGGAVALSVTLARGASHRHG